MPCSHRMEGLKDIRVTLGFPAPLPGRDPSGGGPAAWDYVDRRLAATSLLAVDGSKCESTIHGGLPSFYREVGEGGVLGVLCQGAGATRTAVIGKIAVAPACCTVCRRVLGPSRYANARCSPAPAQQSDPFS